MKTKKIISKVCNWLGIGILLLIILVAGSLLTLQLLGYQPMAILSGSMEPSYHVGGLVFIDTNVTPEDMEIGDAVSFHFSGDTIVTHRIVAIQGQSFIVKGDANNIEDGAPVPFDAVIGRAWTWYIPGLGNLIVDLDGRTGLAMGALVLALLLVLFTIPVLLTPSKKKKGTPAGDAKTPKKKKGAPGKEPPEPEKPREEETAAAEPETAAPEPEAPAKEAPQKGDKASAKEIRSLVRQLKTLHKKIMALDKMKKLLLIEKKELKSRVKALEKGTAAPTKRNKPHREPKRVQREQREPHTVRREDERHPVFGGRFKLAVLSILTVAFLTVGTTLALFYSQTSSATNALPFGYVNVEVVEDKTLYKDIEPGEEIAEKRPTAMNTGSVDSWVRVMVAGALDKFDIEYNDAYWEDGNDGYWYYKDKLPPMGATESIFTSVILKPGVDVSAFLKPGAPEDSTYPEDYDFSSLNIAVYAEAVQSNAGSTAQLAFDSIKP